jgi:hypothetical protein
MMRHNALLQAMMQLVRRRRWSLCFTAKHSQDRLLDIAITYGDLRIMVDVTVAATSRSEVIKKMALNNIEPGRMKKDYIYLMGSNQKGNEKERRRQAQVLRWTAIWRQWSLPTFSPLSHHSDLSFGGTR